MSIKSIYVAGPMTGYEDFNFPAFHKTSLHLRSLGYNVFSPAEADLERYGSLEETKLKCNYRDCLRVDLNWILDNADAIYLLKGWENSLGTAAELALAKALKLEILYEE